MTRRTMSATGPARRGRMLAALPLVMAGMASPAIPAAATAAQSAACG
jgi:hypothetical protein